MSASAPPGIGLLVVIDDARFDHKVYQRVIERSGLVGTVVGFYMAEDALDWLRREDRPDVDVILLDINMPRMSGFEFLEAASAEFGDDFARSVVVMLTTSLDPRDVARAEGFRMVRDYINKPLRPEHIPRIAALLKSAPDAA